MQTKGEIGWTARDADGNRREVFAKHVGDRWCFYQRKGRYDNWNSLEQPPLEDWLELFDAVKRRIQRGKTRPEEEGRIQKVILQRFPGTKL
ncbi:MAG: hypothetical protein EXS24_04035 [Pedosphaera sp.]|nr:hypothetical protein [Pedosphaera sp.]